MRRIVPSRRLPILLGLALVGSLLSCGREITGPGGARVSAAIALEPRFPSIRLLGNDEVLGIGSVVSFVRVRVLLLRANGQVAVDRVVDFPAGQESMTLALTVDLDPAAPSTGEPLTATMKYINTAGDTVFSGGPVPVVARPASSSNAAPPVEVPVAYVGPGANAAGITISPDSFAGVINQQTTFTSIVVTANQVSIPAAPRAYTSTDSARVRVNLSTGVATLLGARGTALIIAQTLTGQADTALVRITPTASALVLVSGGNQQTLQNTPFPAPVRVRVSAVDGVGVSGVTVNFAATRGQGSVSVPFVVTDAAGEAQVNWIAGDSAGAAVLTASVATPALSIPINGQQISSAPASLTLSATPANFAAGDTIPPFSVTVRDAAGGVVNGFGGNVALSLTGGTAGATIVGVATRAAVNGVATFPGLTIDRGGSAYRLVATVTGVPTAQTGAFSVVSAPPAVIAVTRGAGQTAPPSTALADSVQVRVTDMFGLPQPSVTVQFAVVAGGGAVQPTSASTDADGRAATLWTLGAAGVQQITATVGALQPIPVTATVFTGGGTPTLFVGTAQVSAVVDGIKSVPVFITPASPAPIVAQLTMRDTLVARWTADSTIFPAGVGTRSPTLMGRGIGSTYAVVTSSAGTDSVFVTVDSASLRLGSGYANFDVTVGDTLWKLIVLSEPAPAGGLTVTVRSDDTTAMLVAPSSGRGSPSHPCDVYCYDLRADSGGVNILAPPAESAFVQIPAGQLSGQLVLIPIAPTNGVTVSLSAAGYAAYDEQFDIVANTLALYSEFGSLASPIPVGHWNLVRIQPGSSIIGRDVAVRLTSRNPAVVRVDSLAMIPRSAYYNNDDASFGYEAISPGTTWIVHAAPGFPADSFAVTVVSPYLYMPESGVVVSTGSSYDFLIFSTIDSLTQGQYYNFGPRASDLSVDLVSRSPAVAAVSLGTTGIRSDDWSALLQVRGVSPGTAWIVASAPGHVADSVLVTIAGPGMQLLSDVYRVGVGQVHQSMSVYLDGGGSFAPTGLSATVTSSDTSIASILTPELPFESFGYTNPIRIVGKALGTVTLTIAAPGFTTIQQSFQVTTPDLFFNTFGGSGTINADSASYNITVSMRDGVNYARPAADTVFAVLRSLNPSVLLVTDSVVVYPTGSASSFSGRVRAIGPGITQLVLSAPNFTPDTSGLITVRPRALEFIVTSLAHGRGLRVPTTVSRRSPPSAVLPFSLAIQGPVGMTALVPADSFPAGTSARGIMLLAGPNTGTDTVIVSAAGHVPDTLFVVVGTSRAVPSSFTNGIVGEQYDFVAAYLRPTSIFSVRAATDTVKFVLTSSDTSVVRVLSDTVRILPGATQPTTGGYGSMRFVRPGTAYLRYVDPTGLMIGDSAFIEVEHRTLYASQEAITLGMGQRTSPSEIYAYRQYSSDDSLWVRLTSSAPSIASVPDSIRFPQFGSFAYFVVTAGDTVGGARITGSAPGYADFELDVFVTRASFEIYTDESSLGVGVTLPFTVYAVDAASFTLREVVTPLPIRVRSDDPSIVTVGADSIGTIAAGGYETSFNTLTGVRVGRTSVVLEDRRGESVFQHAGSRRYSIDIRPSRLQVGDSRPRVGLGVQNPSFDNYVFASNGGPPVWVQLRSVSGRTGFDSDSVFLDQATGFYANFRMHGLAVGVDTVVVFAPGFQTDTILADVARNTLVLSSEELTTLRVGDSVAVTLTLQTPDGYLFAEVVGAPITFTFGTTGALQVTEFVGGAPLTTLAIPPGESSVSFWLHATAAGGGELSVTSPITMTFRRGVATRGTP